PSTTNLALKFGGHLHELFENEFHIVRFYLPEISPAGVPAPSHAGQMSPNRLPPHFWQNVLPQWEHRNTLSPLVLLGHDGHLGWSFIIRIAADSSAAFQLFHAHCTSGS